MHKATLYIVSTPIGNLQDITYRAISILKNVNYIACEDTRKTMLLLKKLDIFDSQLLISFYDQVVSEKIPNILNLLKNGEDIALVSDSGTPLISDPGYKLVRKTLDEGFNVVPIPGPSALIAALSVSGFPTDKFTFVGFLPRKEGNKLTLLKRLKKADDNLKNTIIVYEAPHRLIKSLGSIRKVFGNTNIVIVREITKIHEERLAGRIDEVIDSYKEKTPKGEFVILINTKV